MRKEAMVKDLLFTLISPFGCWIDKNFGELVPIGKAYSGFSNDELNELDKWVRNNTVQKIWTC